MTPLNVPTGSVQALWGIFLGGCDDLPLRQMKEVLQRMRRRIGG